MIRNQVTNAIHITFYDEMRMQFCNQAGEINQMARVALFRGEGISNADGF